MKKLILFSLMINLINAKVYDGCADFMNECTCSNTGNKGRCLPSTGCQPDADNQTCCNCNNDVLSDQEIEKLQEVAFNKFYRKHPSLLQPIKDALDNKKISYWDLSNLTIYLGHNWVPQYMKYPYVNIKDFDFLSLPSGPGRVFKPEMFLAYRAFSDKIRDEIQKGSVPLGDLSAAFTWYLHPEAYQIKTKLLDKSVVIQELFPTDEACKGKIVNQFCSCGNTGKEGYCWISRQPMPDQPSLAMYCHCD